MKGQAATAVEADTNYLWKMKAGLSAAVAANDKEGIDEYTEALLMLISVTESQAVRIAAHRALASAQTTAVSGPSDTVLPFVRRVLPATSAALAVIVAACSLAATPVVPDPPALLVYEMAVADEPAVCAEWIDRCE